LLVHALSMMRATSMTRGCSYTTVAILDTCDNYSDTAGIVTDEGYVLQNDIEELGIV
jgi:hypothetical protein